MQSRAHFLVCLDIAFAGMKLIFLIRNSVFPAMHEKTEYQNSAFYVFEHFVFFLQQHKRMNGYTRKLFEDRGTWV